MFSILHNLAINRLRQRARRGPHVAIEDVDDAALARPPSQEVGLRHRDILQALGGLAEEQRCVLLLVSVERLSYAETARVLGIPVGTVMSRLARAREKLLRAMQGDEGKAALERPHLRRVK
jgi:RNA polymerase sigma-70 factor (ECF subfamily)